MKINYDNFLEFCSLENAIKFKGKANPKALVGKVLGKYPNKKENMSILMGEINHICDKINNLDPEIQSKKFLKYKKLQKEREERFNIKKKIRAIVFDMDGVIINTAFEIEEKEKKIFEKYNLDYDLFTPYLFSGKREDIPIKKSLKDKILHECEKVSLETDLNEIKSITDFIRSNHHEYMFFTNTASIKSVIEKRFNILDLHKYFRELFYFETGDKKQNILKILQNYNLKSDEILFIDDKISNIDIVRELDINTIHFEDHNLNLYEEVERIEKILNFNELEKIEKKS